MKEGFPNTAENPKMEDLGSIPEPKEGLREKLLDALDPVLRNFFDTKEIHKDYTSLEKTRINAEQLSIETGEFFRELVPKGLNKPENENRPKVGSPNRITMVEHGEILKLLDDEVKELTRKEYKNKKKEILRDSLHGRERVAFDGEIKETEGYMGTVDQIVTNVLAQDGNHNLIYERVSNHINKQRKYNDSEASLVIQDIKTGITLDLNALLPSWYTYTPKAMDKVDSLLISSNKIMYHKKQKEVANLRDYKMEKSVSNQESFEQIPFLQVVNYGDLRKTGGLLTLLHEVAHAWQSSYKGNKNESMRSRFEETYDLVNSFIKKLGPEKDEKDYQDPENIWKKLEEMGITCLDKDGVSPLSLLNEEGVFHVPNKYYYDYIESLQPQVEKLNLSDNEDLEKRRALWKEELELVAKIRLYPIKGGLLQKSLDNYVAEERDAWAHAIKTLRFLRGRGLDLEPELKDIEDFRKKVDPCLESYQRSLDSVIKKINFGYKFIREVKNKED